MADFSKQWCEINDPEMPHDFDIFEEHSRLQPGYGINFICEGFGFVMIAKGHSDEILLAILDEEDPNMVIWVDYDDFIDKELKNHREFPI
jgi:hypothetical protein